MNELKPIFDTVDLLGAEGAMQVYSEVSKVYTEVTYVATDKIGEYLPVSEKSYMHKGQVEQCMPFLVPIIAWVATTFAVSTAIATSIVVGAIMSVISIGISIITRLIMGKPSMGMTPVTGQASIRQPITYHRMIYGKTQVGGVYTFILATGSSNNNLEPVITLAGHKIHSMNGIYFDGIHKFSGSNLTYEINLGDPFFTGQPFPNLVSNSNGYWTADDRQQGNAGVHLQLVWDVNVYPNGLPASIAFNINGRECYDPRNNVAFTAYSIGSHTPSFALTKITANASGGNTTYYGTITGGASNSYAGQTFTVTGFTHSANNGAFSCVSSTATSITLANASGVIETHAATATLPTVSNNLATLTGPGSSSSPAFELKHDGVNKSTIRITDVPAPNDFLNGIWQVDTVNSGNIIINLNTNLATGVAIGSPLQPTTSTTSVTGNATQLRWTDNPAICILDYLMDRPHGMAVPLDDIDIATVIAAANICDETVEIRAFGGGTQTLTSVDAAATVPTVNGVETAAVYHGTIVGGGTNALVGEIFTVTGFTNSANNGVFTCVASTSTTLTLANTLSVAETHAGSAVGAGSTEKRYTCNGGFDVSSTRADILKSLLQAMGGYLVAPGDLWRMYAAAYRTPTVTLTDTDFRDTLKVQTRQSRSSLFNSVRGTFTSPANNYSQSNYPSQPPSTDAPGVAYQTEDGEIIWDDFQLDFTNSPTMAQRLARIHLEKIRRQIIVTAPCKLTAYQVQAGDVVEITHDNFGWLNKTFEVLQVDLAVAKGQSSGAGNLPEADGLGVDLLLRETDGDIYAWDPNVNENICDEPGVPLLPATSSVAPVSGMFLLSDNTTMSTAIDGVNHARIFVTWDQHTDEFVLSGGNVEVWYKLHTDTTYLLFGRAAGNDQNKYVAPVIEGKVYDIQLIAVNSHGAHSSPVTQSVTVSAAPSLNQSSGTTVTNSNFESSTAIIPPPGWQNVGNPTVSYDSTTPYFGKGQSIKIVGALNEGLQQVARTACLPGDEYKISAAALADGTHSAEASIVFYDKFDVPTGSVTATTTSNTWGVITAVGITPANTVNYAVNLLQVSAGTHTVEFDQVAVIRVAVADEVPKAWKIVVKGFVDSPYTAGGYESVMVDTSGGDFVLNLPAASNDNPVQMTKITPDSHIATAVPASGTIDGVSSFSIEEQGESLDMFPDGANWWLT